MRCSEVVPQYKILLSRRTLHLMSDSEKSRTSMVECRYSGNGCLAPELVHFSIVLHHNLLQHKIHYRENGREKIRRNENVKRASSVEDVILVSSSRQEHDHLSNYHSGFFTFKQDAREKRSASFKYSTRHRCPHADHFSNRKAG